MRVTATRLETVLRVKQLQVKTTERELARIAGSKESENGKLSKLNEKQEIARSEVLRTERASARDLVAKREFIETIAGTITHQQKRIREIVKQENATRDLLIEQSKSEGIVGRLDAKLKEAEVRRQEERDQKIIDGIAGRKKSGA